ncbi:MAG: SAVED domain-containing protein [Desulfobulbus sp.]|jgi:hypothetical protein|uniref:SAVED domain-containing protein n=1 Tax=Desulfobulbus sp. TaxID=895 RepID=UPI00284F824C|nr:SAVED domain-containing protein [Desulfobulbus sp.]MDR2551115.1 SAVED domain-containing protein [Desulfobulbus sp.]
MSHTSVADKIKFRLWVAAGGRCQYPGCNKPLYRDDLTLAEMNRSNIAHIIADSPIGPRGDSVLSVKLATDFNNLMLMCYDHHHLIDHEGLTEHPVDVLRAMKAEHERRIETVSGIHSDRKSDVLIYTARIGDFYPHVTFAEAATAVLANQRYPASSYPHDLGRGNGHLTDAKASFWQQEEEHLRAIIRERIIPPHTRGDLKAPSIFAIAPQPLLILLGHLIRDISAADVYQRHREPLPPGWAWQDHPEGFTYNIDRPKGENGPPVLVLALSAPIAAERVTTKIGKDAAIWQVTIQQPNNDYLKSAQQLQQFRELIRPLLDEIKDRYAPGTLLNVFPAAPVAICVELGRAIQPKAHMPMRLWDQNNDLGGFIHALDINNLPPREMR